MELNISCGINNDKLHALLLKADNGKQMSQLQAAYFYLTGSNGDRIDMLNFDTGCFYYKKAKNNLNKVVDCDYISATCGSTYVQFINNIINKEEKIAELETKIKEQSDTIKELEDKIEELELTPPLEGGIEYQRAKMRFERGSSPTTPAIPFE